jgi:hypothetical protein
LFANTTNDEKELTFSVGDRIRILKQDASGWAKGKEKEREKKEIDKLNCFLFPCR